MLETHENGIARRMRIIMSNIRYRLPKNQERLKERLCCCTHGEVDCLFVQAPKSPVTVSVCPECFAYYFQELKMAVPVDTPESLPDGPEMTEKKCYVDGCSTRVDYHDTCYFCKSPVCEKHSDSAGCCFGCLRDIEGEDYGRPEKSCDRGS